MNKILVLLFIFPFGAFSLEKEKTDSKNKETSKESFSIQKQLAISDCRLIEEQVNGITEIRYEYDSQNRLIAKKYVRLKYSEVFKYDAEGYLVGILNNDFNGYSIDFKYKNGLLVSKTKTYQSLSTPIVNTYEYNAANELVKMTETYISSTVTEYSNGKAIKMTNPHINFELNNKGLIASATSISGTGTVNTYKYDKNDMLVLHEIYSEPNMKIMYNEYENSNVKRTKMGADFVDTYKGFPVFKNPTGESTFYTGRISKYSTNSKNGLIEKVYENKTIQTLDVTGKITNELQTLNSNTPSTVYIYSGCN